MGSFCEKSAAPAALDKASISSLNPNRETYSPVSSIPKTSKERLAYAATGGVAHHKSSSTSTVLYLAYGSNMNAQTFLGVRGIRPLSQVNVSAPSLRLTFDLPGIPYREPCFANVSFRKVSEKAASRQNELVHQTMDWDGGLVGVVYEVTQEDWRNIMRTEGAGSSYKEILVPCFPISPKETLPTDGPQSFLATTLYAPQALDADQEFSENSWWKRLFEGRQRPNPDYAQASLRYLNLLRTGGEEHDLPASYQKYLHSLRPYTTTRWSQTFGQIAFLGLWAPPLMACLGMARVLADQTGNLPPWLAHGLSILNNFMWLTYDVAFKPVFGDGERTERDNSVEYRIPLSNAVASA